MRQRINNLLRPTLLVFTFVAIVATQFFAPCAWAARVIKSKGNNVLIDLEGDASSATVGDKYFVMVNGKKRGLVTLTKIKGGKALASLDKGAAAGGAPLALARAFGSDGESAKQASSSQRTSSRRRRADRLDKLRVGVLVGDSIDSQSVKLSNSSSAPVRNETVKMTGSGISLRGFATIPLSGNLGITGRAGFEIFHVTGTSTQDICTPFPNSDCYTKVTYLTVDALLRYQFPLHGWTPFVEGGLGIYVPMSKSTTALNPNISTTSVFDVGAGVDINIGRNGFIPIVLEYGLFPPSSDVTSGAFAIRLGYGLRI